MSQKPREKADSVSLERSLGQSSLIETASKNSETVRRVSLFCRKSWSLKHSRPPLIDGGRKLKPSRPVRED